MATTGQDDATIAFRNESWTKEGARLLLEVDEGWMGFRGDFAWSWHDSTFMVYSAVCRERNWPCNSLAASVPMLMALRAGGVSMKLSSSTRTADGFAQWSLLEMRELGAQMRRIVDGRSPAMRWAAQLLAFVETMKTLDTTYSTGDRTVEDFATRASKYIPQAIVMLIDPHRTNGKTSLGTRETHSIPISTSTESTRFVLRDQLMEKNARERDDEPLVPETTRKMPTVDRAMGVPIDPRARITSQTKSVASNTNKSYRGLAVNEQAFQRAMETFRHVSRSSGSSSSSKGTSPERLSIQPSVANRLQRSLPQDVTQQWRTDFSALRNPFRDDEQGPSGRPYLGQKRQAPFRPDTGDRAPLTNGIRVGSRPTRKCPRAPQSVSSDSGASARIAPHVFRPNPYDRPGTSWGEFVVGVLLAERMARNEDELDYWHFVRSLYDI